MSGFGATFRETVRLAWRSGGGALVPLVFLLGVISVVPFAVGPDLNLLARIGPAVLWLGVLLATLLGLDRLFRDDRTDGTLDLVIVSGETLELYVLARALGHWVASVLPLVLAAPLFGLMLNAHPRALLATFVTLLAGTPALAMLGALGAALSAGLGRGGAAIAVLVLPLTVPVLIFGVSATIGAVQDPEPFLQPFLLLIAASLASGVLAPIAGAAALRAGME